MVRSLPRQVFIFHFSSLPRFGGRLCFLCTWLVLVARSLCRSATGLRFCRPVRCAAGARPVALVVGILARGSRLRIKAGLFSVSCALHFFPAAKIGLWPRFQLVRIGWYVTAAADLNFHVRIFVLFRLSRLTGRFPRFSSSAGKGLQSSLLPTRAPWCLSFVLEPLILRLKFS
jgi:hypothetical protein